MIETFDHPNRVRMRHMPAKLTGRPNEDRKVKELLNKLEAQIKTRKRTSEDQSSRGPAKENGASLRQAV
jgi:hypothetical protein